MQIFLKKIQNGAFAKPCIICNIIQREIALVILMDILHH